FYQPPAGPGEHRSVLQRFVCTAPKAPPAAPEIAVESRPMGDTVARREAAAPLARPRSAFGFRLRKRGLPSNDAPARVAGNRYRRVAAGGGADSQRARANRSYRDAPAPGVSPRI